MIIKNLCAVVASIFPVLSHVGGVMQTADITVPFPAGEAYVRITSDDAKWHRAKSAIPGAAKERAEDALTSNPKIYFDILESIMETDSKKDSGGGCPKVVFLLIAGVVCFIVSYLRNFVFDKSVFNKSIESINVERCLRNDAELSRMISPRMLCEWAVIIRFFGSERPRSLYVPAVLFLWKKLFSPAMTDAEIENLLQKIKCSCGFGRISSKQFFESESSDIINDVGYDAAWNAWDMLCKGQFFISERIAESHEIRMPPDFIGTVDKFLHAWDGKFDGISDHPVDWSDFFEKHPELSDPELRRRYGAETLEERLEAEEMQIQELYKTWSANRLDYGIRGNAWLFHRFGAGKAERFSDEQLRQMEMDGLAAIRKLVALRPDNTGYRLSFGRTLMYRATMAPGDTPDFREAAKEALPHFRAAAALERRDYEWAESTFWVAEAQYALGDLDGARETLQAIASRNLRTWRRGSTDWTALAKKTLTVLKGITFDEYRLPKDIACRAFPEAHKASYRETYTELEAVKLELTNVKADDARVRLLKTKLNRLGVAVRDGAPFTVSLALDPMAPVDKPEGYALAVDAQGACVAARDAQGVLWGVVSLLQVTDPERRRIRHCEILDWPDCPKRGYMGSYFPETAEFAIFAKHNSVNLRSNILRDEFYTPLRALLCRELAKEFEDLGLTLFYGVSHLTMYPQLPVSDPRTKPYHVAQLRRYAALGAGVYWPLDRRYPIHPKDREAYGDAANFDARYVSELYREVKKTYPDFKMIFCPPFYWGPDSRASYPEDREKYLASLGRDLDPEIDVYWTGAQIKACDRKPYQVEWFVRLTGRKPSVFQNGIGPHNQHDFLVDPIQWDKMHYKGFVKDIGHFHNNARSPGSAGPIYTEADWLWYEEAYDAKRAAKAGVNLLLGPKMYDILAEGLEDLSYFDKYKYGLRTSEIAVEDLVDHERHWQHASDCWARAVAYNPDVTRYGYYGTAVNKYRKVLSPESASSASKQQKETENIGVLIDLKKIKRK